MIEPVHPLERGVFHRFEVVPGPSMIDEFSLVQAVDRFRQRIDAPMSCQVGIGTAGAASLLIFGNK